MNIIRCAPAKHVFVAIPSYTSKIEYDTAYSLIECMPRLMMGGTTVSMKILEGNCYIDMARNELVGEFLASEATDLLFIDADVGFDFETVRKICSSTRPFVGAVYPKKTDNVEFPVDFLPGYHGKEDDGVIEVAMIPTGMMRLNRMVFTALEGKSPVYKGRAGREERAYFKTAIRDAYYGEDVEFCRNWRDIGGKIYAFADETMSHTGPKAWIGNLQNAIRGGKLK